MDKFIRYSLELFLLAGAYTETGIFTVIILALMTMALEIHIKQLEKRDDHEKISK